MKKHNIVDCHEQRDTKCRHLDRLSSSNTRDQIIRRDAKSCLGLGKSIPVTSSLQTWASRTFLHCVPQSNE